jgi:hypothetical protein
LADSEHESLEEGEDDDVFVGDFELLSCLSTKKEKVEKRFQTTSSLVYYPWSMITDNRIFSRNFAVYGHLR